MNIKRTNSKSRERKVAQKEEKSQDGANRRTLRDSGEESEAFAMLCRCLIEHRWYHGVMPRGEISTLLEDDGDFCVRKTTEKSRPIVCISVKSSGEVRHFPLIYEYGVWSLKNLDKKRKYYEIVDLLNALVTERISLSGAVLTRAVPRPDYYISHDDIQLVCKLGEGAFGEVWKGILRRHEGGTEKGKSGVRAEKVTRTKTYAAVKRMKGNATKTMTEEFVMEAKLMRQLVHPNIVTVYGVAPSEEPLMIVLELAANGCLKSYVAKYQCPLDQLVQFTCDAARGMAYLSSQMVIHRDLAARNLLLGSAVEVKISDFGLSSAGKAEVKINKMKLPIRWLAPETIEKGMFTTKTDVWSYAVTLWEIFSRCSSDPFPGFSNQKAKELIRGDGLPMNPPEGTPQNIVKIMEECFSKNPANRPSFATILKRLIPSEDVSIYETKSALKMSSSNEATSGLQKKTEKSGENLTKQ